MLSTKHCFILSCLVNNSLMNTISELFDENIGLENSKFYRPGVYNTKKYYGKFGLNKMSYKEGDNEYIIINSPIPLLNESEKYLTNHISLCLKKLIGAFKNFLVVGLGNRHISSDSLGCNAIRYVCATTKGKIKVCSISTSVTSLTGISAYDIIYSLVNSKGIDCVILVDSLCASSPTRLVTSYQIHNAGISPGSGVDNNQKNISKESIGVEVITIGVPLVMYASALGKTQYPNMIVTVKDIDIVCKHIARIVGNAINMAVHHIDYDHSNELNKNIF